MWGKFKVGDLFGPATRGKRLKASDRLPGKLPFVTAGENNQGVSGFVSNDIDIFEKNTITIDMFGSAKYRGYRYGADDHVAVVHTENLPKPVVLFITSSIERVAHTGAFDYSRNFYAKDANDLTISLPVNQEGTMDFEGMEAYIKELEAERIKELEAERIKELEAYLVATGLNDYVLTDEEKNALSEFRAHNTEQRRADKVFKIGELFNIQPTKNYGFTNKKLFENAGRIPVVSNKSTDNGIAGYVDLLPTEKGNVVTFSDTTTDDAIFYQPNDFIGYSHIQRLYPKKNVNTWNEKTYLFFISIFKCCVRGKYNYGTKFNRKNASMEQIVLPTLPDGNIAFDHMERYINAIEKLVIKDAVEWKDRQIEATRDVVNSD